MRLLVLAAALAGLLLVTGRAMQATREPEDPGERKINAAKRFLYYVVTSDKGPEFRLSGGERELHIISHAVLPGAPPFDAARQVTYGLKLELIADGAVIWGRDLYTRSRQSKARREHGRWLDEAAFAIASGLEVTDDRLIVARLPEDARAGATLRVRLVGGEVGEALVRVYDRAPRLAARVELRLRSLSPAAREELAEELSYTPWDRLHPVERTARLRHQRLRMPAVGREGEDYETRALYVTDFRLAMQEPDDSAAGGIEVMPARAAAVNIVGPVELRLEVARGPTLTPSQVPAVLGVASIGEGGQPPPIVVPVPPSPTMTVQSLEVPAGLHSLHLTTDAREGLRVTLAAPAGSDAQLGVPQAPALEEQLAPQAVLLPGTILEAGSPPLVLGLRGPDDLLARVVRVDARLLPVPTPPGSAVTGEVTVETLDGDGKRLTTQTVHLSSVVSPFEEVRSAGVVRIVGEPASFRLIVPAAARRLEVRAAQPMFVRAHALATLAPMPDTLAPPFDAVQLVSSVWRYAPFDDRSWIPVLPQNRAELVGREGRLAAQVRLEPAPAVEIDPKAAGKSLAPEGNAERQVMLEHEDGWTEGHETVLRPGRAQKLKIGGQARLSIYVVGPPEQNLGQELTVAIDGKAGAPQPIASTRSTFPLEAEPGTHTVLVTTSAPHLRLLVDQPPAGGGEVVALRGVYRMTGPLRVRAAKPAGRTATVNMVVYAPQRDGDPATRFKITVDGGEPHHLEGVALAHLTPGQKTVTLPPADRPAILGFADLDSRTVYYPRLLTVSLGDDLSAGAHTIAIQPAGGSHDLWMRFFIMTTDRDTRERAIQWRLMPRAEGAAQ